MPSMFPKAGRSYFDVSFMVSLECDLECPFCMYDSSPRAKGLLPLDVAEKFIETITPEHVTSFGIYGGEPSLFLSKNTQIILRLPDKPVFVITNGAWSTDIKRTNDFVMWVLNGNLRAVVSGTPEHVKYQDRRVLEQLAEEEPARFVLKPADEKFIPMGKLGHLPLECSQKCDWHTEPTRIALKPNGDVIFQNCDGSYPVVGRAEDGFPKIRERLLKREWEFICPVYRRKY